MLRGSNANGSFGGHGLPDALLKDLALRFVSLPPQQLDAAIAEAQTKLIESLEIERAILIETDEHGENPILTSPGLVSASPDQSSPCQANKCPVCRQVLAGEPVRFPAGGNMGQWVATDAETPCILGYQSVLGFPLHDGVKVFGAMLFAFSRERRAWPDELVNQLEFASQVFASALARKRRELSRQRRAAQSTELLESIRAVVWRMDAASLEITFVSKATESILGYSTEDWLKPREVWAERIHPGDRERVADFLVKAIQEEGDHEFEHRIIAAEGRTVWLGNVAHVVFENGRATELVGVSFDITPLKEAQESLRQALAEVERLKHKLHEENVYLRQKTRVNNGHHRMIGQSSAIRRVLVQAEQVAPTDSTVLLLGETGTGKELLAAYIHDSSARRDRVLVTVNCAAMPGPLVESELFGREKGAFTGSLSRQMGRFELADDSTIFLDEIGELSLEVQSKLLRALEAKQIERLGNPKPVPINVRIIAATNRDLQQEVADGKFRQDLYYRFNVFPIAVPPLRERREDIPLLVWAFIDEFAKTFNKNIESIGRENMEALQQYSWPGNIRELRNLVERAMIVVRGPKLQIPLPVTQAVTTSLTGRKMEEVERGHVLGVLEKSGWRIRGPNGAAETLGLKPTTLEARMAKLGIRRPSAASDL